MINNEEEVEYVKVFVIKIKHKDDKTQIDIVMGGY